MEAITWMDLLGAVLGLYLGQCVAHNDWPWTGWMLRRSERGRPVCGPVLVPEVWAARALSDFSSNPEIAQRPAATCGRECPLLPRGGVFRAVGER